MSSDNKSAVIVLPNGKETTYIESQEDGIGLLIDLARKRLINVSEREELAIAIAGSPLPREVDNPSDASVATIMMMFVSFFADEDAVFCIGALPASNTVPTFHLCPYCMKEAVIVLPDGRTTTVMHDKKSALLAVQSAFLNDWIGDADMVRLVSDIETSALPAR